MKEKNAITVAFKKIVNNNTRFYIHSSTTYEANNHIFRLSAEPTYFNKEKVVNTIELPGRVFKGFTDSAPKNEYGYKSDSSVGTYAPSAGFESLRAEYLQAACDAIPDDASVRFEVGLDYATTGPMAANNMHGDTIELVATYVRGKNRIERRFLLNQTSSLHNSARFGGAK